MLTKDQIKLILDAGKSCIEIESSVVHGLLAGLNESYCSAVEALFNCSGRIVVSGIGKSAIIAQKIVATFNSTGTPSLFMHAADAIHGDLGMIKKEDIVLIISKSGETPELKVLIPLVKNLGSKLIAIVSNNESSLARQSDFMLYVPVPVEAEPNNLAPTASTTAQLVMGDSLAVALLALRGFSPSDFAQFHPGGSLGKQLFLKVSHIYPLHGKPAVSSDAALSEVIMEMTSKRLGVTAVLAKNGDLEGVITDGDLRRMLQNNINFEKLKARDIMNLNPKIIDSKAMAVEAFKLMKDLNITQLLVVENDKYIGVVHLHDLIKEGIL